MKKFIIVGITAIIIAAGVRSVVISRRKPPAVDAAVKQRNSLQQRALQIAAFRHQIASNPIDIAPHQSLAALYARYGMNEECLQELEVLARLQPKNESAQDDLAEAYSDDKKYRESVNTYSTILQFWPRSLRVWQGLSITLYQMENYQKSLWAAKHALALKPTDPHNQFGVAAATLQWAVQSNAMGMHTKEIQSAQKTLEALLPKWQDKAGIHYLLGRAYASQNNVNLALQHLQQANALHPEQADIAFGLGMLYLRQQKIVEGKKVVETALASQPNDPNLNETLGRLWQESGEPGADEKALASFQKAVDAKPDNPAFQDRLGSAFLRANNLDKARAAFENSVKLDENRPYPLQQLAVIYARLGDKTRSGKIAEAAKEIEFNAQQLQHLQSLVYMYPDKVDLHLQLADRYHQLRKNGLSQDEYEAALRIDPQNAHALGGLKSLQEGQ